MGELFKLVGFYSGSQDAVPGQPQRLGDGQHKERISCDVVRLSVLAIGTGVGDILKPAIAAAALSVAGTDVQHVDGTEVYWGFDETCVHPIYPGNTSDDIPVEQLGDIFIRANASSASRIAVGYSCFKYVKKEF
jgi:hypothetical protein